MTFSLVAHDRAARQWGVAVQSKFLAVGSVVPWAEPDAGAIATQAYANPRYGPDGLALLREGLSAREVVDRLVGADEGRAERQLGVVDSAGAAAAWTGAECMHWAGHRTGDGYAAQGNILVGPETVDALVDLRVDDHERPIDELRRIYALHNLLFGRTQREQWLPLEGMLADEVRDRLARLGYDSLDAWAGVANLEARVDGENAIDPIVLEALREDAAN